MIVHVYELEPTSGEHRFLVTLPEPPAGLTSDAVSAVLRIDGVGYYALSVTTEAGTRRNRVGDPLRAAQIVAHLVVCRQVTQAPRPEFWR